MYTNKIIKQKHQTKHHDIIKNKNTTNPTQKVNIRDNTQTPQGRPTFNAHVRILQKQMQNKITIKD